MEEFKERLLDEGWERVVYTGDLVLDEEQTSVGMAVDMDIGRRAGVFIGNGVSLRLSFLFFSFFLASIY